jgi:hypothetical protein
MKDDEPTDYYLIAFYCGLLAVGWVLQVSSLRQFFWVSPRIKPPQFLVVDFNQGRLFPGEDPHKPVARILAEKGLEADARLVTKEEGENLRRDYQIKKWSPLAVAIAGALVAAWFAWLLSGSWRIVMVAIVFAPIVPGLMRGRDWRRGR